MIFITIRLVGGEQDLRYRHIEINPEIHMIDIRKLIQSVTSIPCDLQQIRFRGDELPDSLHPLKSAEDYEEVEVKHSLLSKWSALLDYESSFEQTTDPELQKSIRARSREIILTLMNSSFFSTYTELYSRCDSIENKLSVFQKVATMESSCNIFSNNVFGENANLIFEPRSRCEGICDVKVGSVITRFFVKTTHSTDYQSSPHNPHDADLRELFVYKFLEHLKMGPEIHLIDNKSLSVTYIGSRKISGFKTLRFVELEEPHNVEEYTKVVAQMLFVFSVLMLGGYHTRNMGVDGTGNPFIIDFCIIGKPLTGVHCLCEGMRMSTQFNKQLGTFDERLQISLDYLKLSNFSEILESAVEKFYQDRRQTFTPQNTNDFEKYVENVKNNIKVFNDYSSSL